MWGKGTSSEQVVLPNGMLWDPRLGKAPMYDDDDLLDDDDHGGTAHETSKLLTNMGGEDGDFTPGGGEATFNPSSKLQPPSISTHNVQRMLKVGFILCLIGACLLTLQEDFGGDDMLHDEAASYSFLALLVFSAVTLICLDGIVCFEAHRNQNDLEISGACDVSEEAAARQRFLTTLTSTHAVLMGSTCGGLALALEAQDPFLVLCMVAGLAVTMLPTAYIKHVHEEEVTAPAVFKC